MFAIRIFTLAAVYTTVYMRSPRASCDHVARTHARELCRCAAAARMRLLLNLMKVSLGMYKVMVNGESSPYPREEGKKKEGLRSNYIVSRV